MDLETAIIAAGALAGAVLAVFALSRLVWRQWRRVDRLLTEFLGEPEDPTLGLVGKKGMPERLRCVEEGMEDVNTRVNGIEREFRPNGGRSTYDRLQRIENRLSGEQT